MDDVKINFIDNPDPSRKKFFFFLKIFSSILATVAIFTVLAAANSDKENGLFSDFSQIPFVKQVQRLIHSADRSLIGTEDDRINILLLGIGGEGHDGPYLTDTIILASIKPSTKEVALISIPRDLSAPIPGHGWYKINSANSFGETENPGNGGNLSRQVVSDLFQIQVPYYVRVDFSGFEKLIDELGGVDIYVEKSFIDSSFPSDNIGNVKTISFEAGKQYMDGEMALTYSRSRHGSNGEGSDFARARRQQKVILALKTKIFSLGTLRSPSKINSISEALRNHVSTNLSNWDLLALSRQAGNLDASNIITRVFKDGPDGDLVSTIGVDGAYLLVPKKNDWTAMRQTVKSVFDSVSEISETIAEPAKIEIQNGTTIAGLAASAAALLPKEKFIVTRAQNAIPRDLEKTVIFDLTGGKRDNDLKALNDIIKAEILPLSLLKNFIAANSKPESGGANAAQAAAPPKADFLIILGKDRNWQ